MSKPDPKPRGKFMTGPRDNGPANPPPWPELVMSGMGILMAIVFFAVGVNYEWIGDVYVRGPCAFLGMTGFMVPIFFMADGYDKARARGEYDDEH